jgi:hypothetical protein
VKGVVVHRLWHECKKNLKQSISRAEKKKEKPLGSLFDPDSSYDAEFEDKIHGMVDEAKFFAREVDFLDAGDNIPSELDPFLQDDRKDNPFLKLLGP